MPSIYRGADRVLIWLADADDFETLALMFLDDLLEPSSRINLHILPYGCISVLIFCYSGIWVAVSCFLLSFGLYQVMRPRRRFVRLKELTAAPNNGHRLGVRYRAMIQISQTLSIREDLGVRMEKLGQEDFLQIIGKRCALLLDRPWFKRMWFFRKLQTPRNFSSFAESIRLRGKGSAYWKSGYLQDTDRSVSGQISTYQD